MWMSDERRERFEQQCATTSPGPIHERNRARFRRLDSQSNGEESRR